MDSSRNVIAWGWGTVRRRAFEWVALLILVSTLTFGGAAGRQDSETGKLRILFIGTAFWGTSPGRILMIDPKIDPTLVPIITVWYTDEENRRYMRLYMPRNYEQLHQNQDLIHLAGCDAVMITPNWQVDFSRSVVEQGLGLLMTDGHRGFGGASAQKAEWKGTKIEEEILPVWIYTSEFVEGPLKLRVLVRDNPLMESLPWETAPPLNRLNKLTVKEGATNLADDGSQGFPVLAFWNLGEGRSVIFATDLHGHYAPLWVNDWRYWHDFVLNLEYFGCGAQVPGDPEMMHALRDTFLEYSQRLALLRDMLGFIEDFGANPFRLEADLIDLGDRKREADVTYLEQDYPGALDKMVGLLEVVKGLEEKALVLRDRALQWIYLIEWLVVSGTSMMVGVILWTVMIRRRFYREIGTTRAG